LPVGRANNLSLFSTGQTRAHLKALCRFRCQGIDRRQLKALAHRTAGFLACGRCGDGQFCQQNVEAIDGQPACFRALPQQLRTGGTHLLKCHVGGAQGAVFLKDVAQSAGIHRKDAGVTSDERVAHITQEPAEVADGLAHEGGTVFGHADGVESGGKHHADVGVSTGAFEQTREEVAPFGDAAVTGESAHGLFESHLVSRQRGGVG